MTKEEAKKKAEEVVYVWCTLPDIISRCEFAGIETHTKGGRRVARCVLEEKLITHYTEKWATEV